MLIGVLYLTLLKPFSICASTQSRSTSDPLFISRFHKTYLAMSPAANVSNIDVVLAANAPDISLVRTSSITFRLLAVSGCSASRTNIRGLVLASPEGYLPTWGLTRHRQIDLHTSFP